MKKFWSLVLIVFLLVVTISGAMVGEGKKSGNGPGPAPNSGDGIPDGPGW